MASFSEKEIECCLNLANFFFSRIKCRNSDKHQNMGLCLGFDSPGQQRLACPVFKQRVDHVV